VRQRALDIAGIERLEKIQHTLPVEVFSHFFSAGVRSRLAVPARIVDGISAGASEKQPKVAIL
jgi:hypothetical protein